MQKAWTEFSAQSSASGFPYKWTCLCYYWPLYKQKIDFSCSWSLPTRSESFILKYHWWIRETRQKPSNACMGRIENVQKKKKKKVFFHRWDFNRGTSLITESWLRSSLVPSSVHWSISPAFLPEHDLLRRISSSSKMIPDTKTNRRALLQLHCCDRPLFTNTGYVAVASLLGLFTLEPLFICFHNSSKH